MVRKGPMRRLVIACLACAVALLFAMPASAYAAAGSYTIDELSTVLTVETDASAHVIERQVLTFSDENRGVVWYLHVPEDSESIRINSVRVVPVDDGGTLLGDYTRLQMIDSKPSQQGKNPGDTAIASLRTEMVQPWYSYNIGDGMMRCYFPTGNVKGADGSAIEDGKHRTYAIETDYTVSHRVLAYRDVGELYWRYVNDSLPSGANNVSLVVQLPVPSDSDSEAVVQSIHAWGHGPDGGSFDIGGDGTVVYRISSVARGDYAEAHVIFPVDWLVDLPANAKNQYSSLRQADAIAEEAEWVDLGQREAAWDNKVRVLFLVLALIVILAGVVSVIVRRLSPQSHRALVRVAVTLGIMGLAEHLFFREPLTTAMLFALAAIVIAVSFMLPTRESAVDDEEAEESFVADEEEES